MDNNTAAVVLFFVYLFAGVPAIGRAMVWNLTPKKHWVGYNYEKCMERGLLCHGWLAIAGIVIWAITLKLTT